LIIYNTQNTHIDSTLADFNMIHPNIQFTVEKEVGNKLNYLDLTIINKQDKFTYGIYRKPTCTDHIIHNESCHPYEHKKTAINFRMKQ
jgi:DNA mismatch repair ATPase MutL